jgi:hypothetical protein
MVVVMGQTEEDLLTRGLKKLYSALLTEGEEALLMVKSAVVAL